MALELQSLDMKPGNTVQQRSGGTTKVLKLNSPRRCVKARRFVGYRSHCVNHSSFLNFGESTLEFHKKHTQPRVIASMYNN